MRCLERLRCFGVKAILGENACVHFPRFFILVILLFFANPHPCLSVNFCLFPLTSAGETSAGAPVNPFDATTDPPHQLDTPSADEEAQAETTAESTNIFSLEKYTNYSISVLAYTSAGDGVPSSPVYCRTLQDGQCLPALPFRFLAFSVLYEGLGRSRKHFGVLCHILGVGVISFSLVIDIAILLISIVLNGKLYNHTFIIYVI